MPEGPGRPESPVDSAESKTFLIYNSFKKIAEAIYEALPQTPLLFLSQKEAKKLLKHRDFAFCGKRPRASPFGNPQFLKKCPKVQGDRKARSTPQSRNSCKAVNLSKLLRQFMRLCLKLRFFFYRKKKQKSS